MARLYRPHVPLKVRCQVAERQLAEYQCASMTSGPLCDQLHFKLDMLATMIGCDVSELRLDHDPALALRQQFKNGRGEIVRYVPDANSPAHLCYRPHGAQHEDSHDVKTRIRGPHGQFSDLALIKRERRRQRNKSAKKSRSLAKRLKRPWPKRKFESRMEP